MIGRYAVGAGRCGPCACGEGCRAQPRRGAQRPAAAAGGGNAPALAVALGYNCDLSGTPGFFRVFRSRHGPRSSSFAVLPLSRFPPAAPESLVARCCSRRVGVEADYWHFVSVRGAIRSSAGVAFSTARSARPESAPAGELFLIVVPRVGTISPWSSKATDIAWNCGLDAIERIERGIAFRVGQRCRRRLDRPKLAALRIRMTESVMVDFEETANSSSISSRNRFCQRRPARRRPRRARRGQRLPRPGAVRRRNRLPGRHLHQGQSATRRCRTDDVRAGQFRAPPPQDLQRRAGRSTARRSRNAVRHDPRTHQAHPEGTVSAYSDNASIIEGATAALLPRCAGRYGFHQLTHILMKVETHNHPTAIAPFPGARPAPAARSATRAPPARRQAEGRPVRLRSRTCAFPAAALGKGTASRAHRFGARRSCSRARSAPRRLQQRIRPPEPDRLLPHLRAARRRRRRGYHKPIMIAGGLGNIREAEQSFKAPEFPAARCSSSSAARAC